MRTGRTCKLELYPDLQTQITNLLKTGVTVEDACSKVGIDDSTYYLWRKRGKAEYDRRANEKDTPTSKKIRARRAREQLYLDFFEATTRAQADARINAVVTLRTAMMPHDEETETVEEFSETRLDRDGKPYTYTRRVVRKTKTGKQGDWRAALEYLRRRDPEHWTEQLNLAGPEPGGAIPITFIAAPPKPEKKERA